MATPHDDEPSTTLLGEWYPILLAAHEVAPAAVERELSELPDRRLGPTANRSVVGILNEFSFLADVSA
jgi:hypothetical protein